jgi:hypothetical protein
MNATIFYSWQSDTKAAANRTLIQDALESAAKEMRADDSITVEPVVDRDTQAVPGAPDIGGTILEKIDASAAVVADVTIVSRGNGRPTPNPNVLIELGYALKSLGARRLILVQNLAFGGPEDLPFDLRQKRVLTYNSAEDAPSRVTERKALQAALRDALALVLMDADMRPVVAFPVELSLEYLKAKTSSERHDYRLQVTLKNTGTKPIAEWHVDVSMPTRLLDPGRVYTSRVSGRSDEKQTLFRAAYDSTGGVIYPGDTRLVMALDYHMDHAIFRDLRGLFDEKVIATANIYGEITAIERVVRDLQNF